MFGHHGERPIDNTDRILNVAMQLTFAAVLRRDHRRFGATLKLPFTLFRPAVGHS